METTVGKDEIKLKKKQLSAFEALADMEGVTVDVLTARALDEYIAKMQKSHKVESFDSIRHRRERRQVPG